MSQPLSDASKETLRLFVDGQMTIRELQGWLASIEYDDDLDDEERDDLASLSLIVTEVVEEMRPPDEILSTVVRLLGRSVEVNTVRSSASTVWSRSSTTSANSEVQHARISA